MEDARLEADWQNPSRRNGRHDVFLTLMTEFESIRGSKTVETV